MGDAVTQRWSAVLRTLASLRGGTVPPEQHLTTTSGGQEGIGAFPIPPAGASRWGGGGGEGGWGRDEF